MTPAEELAGSIKANGVIQPILVRRTGDTSASSPANAAGARRSAPASGVPVVVRDVAEGEKQLLELALIENIQREDLNPVDEALAYQRLADEFALTQEQIAAAVGKDRSSVANYLRLLKLPEEVRADLASGALRWDTRARSWRFPTPRRSGTPPAKSFPRLSVRETEALVKLAVADLAETVPRHAANRRRTCTRAPPRSDALRPRHESPHRPPRHRRQNRDRFRLGNRAESDLRAVDRVAADPSQALNGPRTAPRGPSFRGINRRLCL